MRKLWWCTAVVAQLALFACSDDKGGGDNSSGGPAPTNVAGTGSEVSNSAAMPPRAGRGTVTLLGASQALGTSSYTFSGPAEDPPKGEDTVSCNIASRGDQVSLEVSAKAADKAAPAATFSFELAALTPSEQDVSASTSTSLELAVALTRSGDTSAYRYEYAATQSAIPVSSSCTVTLTEISSHWVAGQVACRNLLASTDSADAAPTGAAAPRASATIAFDCPIVATSLPKPSGGGGSAGVAGSGSSGSASGGSSSGGGGSGSGGSGISPPKSCHGIPPSCSARTAATCSSVQGCSPSGDCKGISRGCYAYFDVYSCSSQEGCVWLTYSKYCSGSSWSCDLMNGSFSCNGQDGCNWEETCDGVATPCSLLGEFTCTSQPGCTWD